MPKFNNISYILPHYTHVIPAGVFYVGVARMLVLLDGSEAAETDSFEGRDNCLDVHHAPAERRELSHQAVDIAHVHVHQVPADFVDGDRGIFALEQRPAHIDIVAQIIIANLVPQP